MKVTVWVEDHGFDIEIETDDEIYLERFTSDPPGGQSAVEKYIEFIRPILSDRSALDALPWKRTVDGYLSMGREGDE